MCKLEYILIAVVSLRTSHPTLKGAVPGSRAGQWSVRKDTVSCTIDRKVDTCSQTYDKPAPEGVSTSGTGRSGVLRRGFAVGAPGPLPRGGSLPACRRVAGLHRAVTVSSAQKVTEVPGPSRQGHSLCNV